MTAPLEGLRVIDTANWLAAPAAAGLMANLGADVIKVEPPTGDTFRGVQVRAAPGDRLAHGGWENDNRGKRGIALDLDRPEAREVLLRLIEDADVLVTNFNPQRAERFGLTYESVRERNPRIIFVAFSGYGSHGPDANRLGYDFLAFWARSGLQHMIGEVSGPPVQLLPGQGDHTTALNILSAVLVALRLRDQTGEGQRVEVTLQQTGVWVLSNQIQDALLGNPRPAKVDRRAPRSPITNTYPTGDGRWIQMMNPPVERDWPKVCRALDRPEWAEEFPDFASITDNAAELRERIEARMSEEPLDHWAARFDTERVLWAPVMTVEEVLVDPQIQEMQVFERVEHPRAGTIDMVSAPFHIDGADIRIRRSAPDVGEHTYEILTEAGYDSDEIASFTAAGAFG